jgi:hypothetical protein
MIRIVGGKPQGEAELAKKDLGAVWPLGFTRDGTFYYSSGSQGPSLFTATLDLEKGTATATPHASEKFNILDQLTLGDWSPDGEHLAYSARSGDTREMRIVSLKTGQTRVLKPNVNINRALLVTRRAVFYCRVARLGVRAERASIRLTPSVVSDARRRTCLA